jgi:hypothetical protein
MNRPVLTRAAEGLDRGAGPTRNFRKLSKRGIMDADAPVELIRGEIVPRPVETDAHLRMRSASVAARYSDA